MSPFSPLQPTLDNTFLKTLLSQPTGSSSTMGFCRRFQDRELPSASYSTLSQSSGSFIDRPFVY